MNPNKTKGSHPLVLPKEHSKMSSHHFVKELQEPALLIADGEQCQLALLEGLLEWSPLVVALDGAFEKLVRLGVKVDYWLGDFDDINPELEKGNLGQDHVTIVRTPDQNKTDFEKGLDFLIAKDARSIHVLWATGKRMDHALSNYASLTKYQNLAEIVVYNDYSKSFLLKPHFEKWYKKGEIISLMPLPKAGGVQTSGLKYGLDNEDLEWGLRLGTSNEVASDGLVSIKHSSGHLLLIEAND
mgnify:CR=1 FL=1